MVDSNKFAEEEAMGYSITIVGRNLVVTEAIKNYVWDKITKIERFHNHIMDAHVTIDIQRVEHVVTIVLTVNQTKIKVQADSTDMYASIDKAIDKLQAQLRRYKSRLQDHHRKGWEIVDMMVEIWETPRLTDIEDINDEIEAETERRKQAKFLPPELVGTETRALKMLTTDEAMMKMDLAGDQFLIYRGEEDQKIKVMYRRSDGKYGVIQPE